MDMVSPWIDAVGWTLLHFIWQGALVGALWAALRALLPRQASEARHALGLLALAALALAPVLTLGLLWPADGAASSHTGLLDSAVAAGAAVVAPAGAVHAIGAMLPWLVAVWIAGVCVLAMRALLEWRRLDHIVRRCAKAHAQIDALLASVSSRFGIVQRVRALVSEHVDTPMLVGWLRPVILLPTAVALGFPHQQVELILAHELGHLRRFDHWINLAQTVLETVLFYHPAVHWISREVRNERELCCDHLVLRTMQGEPYEYARTLAALEELRLANSFALAASGGDLIERVRRIVGASAPRLAVEGRGSGRWLLIAAGMMLAWTFAQRIDRDALPPLVAHGPAVDWIRMPAPSLALAPSLLEMPMARWRAPRVDAAAAATIPESALAAPVQPTAEVAAVTPAAVAAAPTPTPAMDPTAALRVEAVPAPAPKPAEVAVAEPARAVKPVALHTVLPEFPGDAYATRISVEASFVIAADGSVRNIRLDGRADKSFKRAVEAALRQWRFDPASLTAGSTQRYTQMFVFAPPGESNGEEGCVRQTGSMMCRSAALEAVGKVNAAGG